MTTLAWIALSGLLMGAIALVGSVTLVRSEAALERLLKPLVALAAGSLLGGAFLHMLPGAVHRLGVGVRPFAWCLAGFVTFLVLEQFLHWHPATRAPRRGTPLTVLLLVADGLHNLIGGMAVGAAFLADHRLGLATWVAAAAHEVKTRAARPCTVSRRSLQGPTGAGGSVLRGVAARSGAPAAAPARQPPRGRGHGPDRRRGARGRPRRGPGARARRARSAEHAMGAIDEDGRGSSRGQVDEGYLQRRAA